jgi:hypothetical protein
MLAFTGVWTSLGMCDEETIQLARKQSDFKQPEHQSNAKDTRKHQDIRKARISELHTTR